MNRIMTRDKTYYQSLIHLALPVAAQNLVAFLVTFADNLMVSSLGDTAVSGVYFASQINTLLQMFTSGISGAIVILSAQYWGKGDTNRIKRIISIGVHFALGIGLAVTAACLIFPENILTLFTRDAMVAREGVIYLRTVCFSYLFFCVTQSLISAMRSVEVTKIGMVVSVISLAVNVVLNAVFIYACRWGVFGAALATVICRAVETAVIAVYVLTRDQKLRMRARDFLATDALLRKDFIRYGLPLVGGEVVWSVNMLGNSIIFGQFFDKTVSTAVSITNTMGTMAYIAIYGLAAAVGIITGKTVGAGKTELMKEYARTTQAIFLCVGILSGVLVALLNRPFVSLYASAPGGGISPEAAAQAVSLIFVLSVSTVGTGYQMPCLFGLVKSGGDISFVFKNDTIFVFCVVLPSAFIAAKMGAPAWAVFACLKCDQILKCFVAVVKINRFNWMKNLTRAKAA